MKYFFMEPEVAGGLGKNTIMDRSTHPPIVSKLHYEFDGWLGDAILETFPSFIVTDEARRNLQAVGATGAAFGTVEIAASESLRERQPGLKLPAFVWLQVKGVAGRDDFGIAQDGRLVVSERALDILRPLGLSHADLSNFGEP